MKKIFREIFLALITLISLDVVPCRAEESPESASAPTIRTIKVEVRDVFDENDLAWFYRAVNSVKISTRESVVRQELLFKEGDTYSEFLVAESERALRRLPYLRQISVTPLKDGEFVDILVSVQDTWTLFPFISFSLGSGTDKTSFGIAETNFGGYGKRAEVLYADDEGREKIEGVFEDRRLFGTKQQLTLGLFDRSDGYRTVGFYGKPFRSLVEHSAWNVDWEIYDLVGKLYEDAEESFIYREKREAVSAGYTVAFGEPTEKVRRLTAGYDYSSSKFEEADDKDFRDADVDPEDVSRDPALLASDRVFSGPFIALQSIEPSFVSMNFLDRFERVEDYNIGNELYARLTFAADALGSERDTLLFNVSDADGMKITPTSFVRGKIGIVGRADTDQVTNTVFSSDFRYYNVLGAKYIGDEYIGKHTFVASLSMDFADRLDRDKQLVLGATNGLRGYKDRSFTGEQRLVLNLEHRVYFVEDLWKLVSVGSAVFGDLGGVSDSGLGGVLTDDLFSDVGLGLRIGFPRSSGGSVLRIDLAFPTRDGPDGARSFEPRILFTTGQLVNARLPNESQQSPGSNVTVRFLP